MNYSLVSAETRLHLKKLHLKVVTMALICGGAVGLVIYSSQEANSMWKPHVAYVQSATNIEHVSCLPFQRAVVFIHLL